MINIIGDRWTISPSNNKMDMSIVRHVHYYTLLGKSHLKDHFIWNRDRPKQGRPDDQDSCCRRCPWQLFALEPVPAAILRLAYVGLLPGSYVLFPESSLLFPGVIWFCSCHAEPPCFLFRFNMAWLLVYVKMRLIDRLLRAVKNTSSICPWLKASPLKKRWHNW